ncbi:MAG: hypothetical protein HZA79_13145 [Sphingobacteriales bacterium]|nr:hypothetical protein [Sphingobacteriales bacterium]
MKGKTGLLLLAWLLVNPAAKSQSPETKIPGAPEKIIRQYYRINPFNKEFSSFLQRLMNDPTLSNTTIHRKTDSTLFFLEGNYTTHRPFFFPAGQVKVILAERELTPDLPARLAAKRAGQAGSAEDFNTVFLYQLVGYAPGGKEGEQDVKKEFEKLSRQYQRVFEISSPRELKSGQQVYGEVRDFYFTNVFFPILTLAWSTSGEKENLVAITVRFMVYNNAAYLPIAANGP